MCDSGIIRPEEDYMICPGKCDHCEGCTACGAPPHHYDEDCQECLTCQHDNAG